MARLAADTLRQTDTDSCLPAPNTRPVGATSWRALTLDLSTPSTSTPYTSSGVPTVLASLRRRSTWMLPPMLTSQTSNTSVLITGRTSVCQPLQYRVRFHTIEGTIRPVNMLTRSWKSGSPGIWKDVTPPYTLQTDTKFMRGQAVVVDQNGHRFPSSPTLPLFKSVDAFCALTDAAPPKWPAVDVVTDRNGLRKLMRWASASGRGKEFRIDIDLAGRKTVLMTRWESRTAEHSDDKAYGLNFEHRATKVAPGCGGTTSHHRIITYVGIVSSSYALSNKCPISPRISVGCR